MTQILPTNYYLKRYRIKDTDLCSKCDTERDTVLHNMWLCPVLVPYIEKIINFLKNECNVNEDITLVSYFFGFDNNPGLNHILIELKKFIFYGWDINVNLRTFCERFENKIRNLIIKEKHVMIKKGKFEPFSEKWKNFTNIYDYFGPDLEIVC